VRFSQQLVRFGKLVAKMAPLAKLSKAV